MNWKNWTIGISTRWIRMTPCAIEIGSTGNRMIVYLGPNALRPRHPRTTIPRRINVAVPRTPIEMFVNRFLLTLNSNNSSSSNSNNVQPSTISNGRIVVNSIKHNSLNLNQRGKRRFHFFNLLLHRMPQPNTRVIGPYLDSNQGQSELEVSFLRSNEQRRNASTSSLHQP